MNFIDQEIHQAPQGTLPLEHADFTDEASALFGLWATAHGTWPAYAGPNDDDEDEDEVDDEEDGDDEDEDDEDDEDEDEDEDDEGDDEGGDEGEEPPKPTRRA